MGKSKDLSKFDKGRIVTARGISKTAGGPWNAGWWTRDGVIVPNSLMQAGSEG